MRLKKAARWMLGVVLVVALLVSAALGYLYVQEEPADIEKIAWMDRAGTERLLVIAPHCDDETLGCAALIHDVQSAGGEVKVVLVTNGDGFTFATREQFKRLVLSTDDFIRSGYARQVETKAALSELGISEKNIFFLGYPDRGMSSLWENHWNLDQPYRSRFTGYDYTPYTTSYHPNAEYAGAAVLRDLQKILADFHPTLIAVPHPGDEHIDHAAVWAFAMAAMDGFPPAVQSPRVLTYLVHRGDFPIPHGYHPSSVLSPPLPLYNIAPDAWRRYPLDEEQEKVKSQALSAYHSQTMVPVMSALLNSFIRRNELFAVLSIPIVSDIDPGMVPTDPDAWSGQAALIENPPAVSLLGVFDIRRSRTKVFCRRQGQTFWICITSPHFGSRSDRMRLSVVLIRHGERMEREQYTLNFTRHTQELTDVQLVRGRGEAYIGITPPAGLLPDEIFLQLAVRDRLGVLLERSGWFPAQIPPLQRTSTNM